MPVSSKIQLAGTCSLVVAHFLEFHFPLNKPAIDIIVSYIVFNIYQFHSSLVIMRYSFSMKSGGVRILAVGMSVIIPYARN